MRTRYMLIWMLVVSLALGYVLYQPELITTIDEVYDSVAYIEVVGLGGIWSGSGVMIDERGIVLTARHVIEGAVYISVYFSDGSAYKGVDWYASSKCDVGVIQIISLSNKEFVTPKFTEDIVLGEQIFTIGSPLGSEYINTISVGYLSAVDRHDPLFGDTPLLQFDGAANPGNSGGPVFNLHGEIVGIIVGGDLEYEHLIVMVPSKSCEELIEEYVERNP